MHMFSSLLTDPLHQEPWEWDPAMCVAQSPRDDPDVPKLQKHMHRVLLSLSLISGRGLVWHTLQSTASRFSVSGNNGLLKKKSLIKIRISTILYDIFYYDFPSVHTQFNLDMHKKSTITMLINPFATNLKANNWLYYFSLIFVITI